MRLNNVWVSMTFDISYVFLAMIKGVRLEITWGQLAKKKTFFELHNRRSLILPHSSPQCLPFSMAKRTLKLTKGKPFFLSFIGMTHRVLM